MSWLRAALALLAAAVLALALVSGGSSADPRSPAGLAGLPAPFLGTALVGDGGPTAAVDAYGDVVDLRRRPGGAALLEVPAARLAAGSVAAEGVIVPRLLGAPGEAGARLPFWRADAVTQRYRPRNGVLVTTARFGTLRATIVYAAAGDRLACRTRVSGGARIVLTGGNGAARAALRCGRARARATVARAARSDRRWLAGARPLGAGAPAWARELYERSLLTLRALTDARNGAVAAGARDGWAYVWPRDAATATLAFAAAGYRGEARRTARHLGGLDLAAAARFTAAGTPVPGRAAQGDAAGWVAVARRAAGLPDGDGHGAPGPAPAWRDRPDYQEKAAGEYLGNALAASAAPAAPGEPGRESRHGRDFRDPPPTATSIARRFEHGGMLIREAGEPASGADSAAAWAVRPFALPALYPAARASLRRLLARGDRFGILPSENWPDPDPWTAPTAAAAWAFAALARADVNPGPAGSAGAPGRPALAPAARARLAAADRRDALRLLADLRRAATPAGELPERLDAHSGVPRSTTPLAWSHALAVLALRELWPTAPTARGAGRSGPRPLRPRAGARHRASSAGAGAARPARR